MANGDHLDSSEMEIPRSASRVRDQLKNLLKWSWCSGTIYESVNIVQASSMHSCRMISALDRYCVV